jgi:molybdopterin converting factor subunit 1
MIGGTSAGRPGRTSISFVKVRVRLFAVLREKAGRDEVELELADGATVGDAIDALEDVAGLDGVIGRLPVRMAVNRDYASEATTLDPGDELALIPPVSGGADVHARVTGEPLSLDAVAGAVGRPGAGAIVSFQGTTRDVERLDYEAYREMAEQRIGEILSECVERHGLEAAAAEHRVGTVPLGESSVIVAVSAAHRGEAFAGAREAIDRIKAEAPIWKKEVDGAEERWVEGSDPTGTEQIA